MFGPLDAALTTWLTRLRRQLDHNQALLRPAAFRSAYDYGDVRPDQGFWTLRRGSTATGRGIQRAVSGPRP